MIPTKPTRMVLACEWVFRDCPFSLSNLFADRFPLLRACRRLSSRRSPRTLLRVCERQPIEFTMHHSSGRDLKERTQLLKRWRRTHTISSYTLKRESSKGRLKKQRVPNGGQSFSTSISFFRPLYSTRRARPLDEVSSWNVKYPKLEVTPRRNSIAFFAKMSLERIPQ